MPERERIIFHIDVNSAYLSWTALEQLKNGSSTDLRTVPSIIGGDEKSRHGVVLAKSIPAKKYGIQTGEPVAAALRKCPGLVMASPDHRLYREYSRAMIRLLTEEFSPELEQVSIDEAFLDLTGMERIYPLPGKAARMLKESIRDETGLTASIGVAPSRYLSKLASDFRKPDGLTIVPAGMEEEFIDAIPLRKLWGIGDAMLSALERRGLRSAAEIRRLGEDELRRMFGDSSGAFLYKASRGIDPGIYQGEARSRSISSEKTFYPDVYSADAIGSYLLEMSEEVMFRAMDERKIPRTVGIKLRYGDFTTISAQTTPSNGIYSSMASPCRTSTKAASPSRGSSSPTRRRRNGPWRRPS